MNHIDFVWCSKNAWDVNIKVVKGVGRAEVVDA